MLKRMSWLEIYISILLFQWSSTNNPTKAKKRYMCVYCHMSKKSRVGRLGLIIFLLLSAKPEIVVPESDSAISVPKFPVKWRIMQFFYLLCSQFRQKVSSWINKTLLLVKQQKWLSEFCVKIHIESKEGMSLAKIRVGRVTVNTHIIFFGLSMFFWYKADAIIISLIVICSRNDIVEILLIWC